MEEVMAGDKPGPAIGQRPRCSTCGVVGHNAAHCPTGKEENKDPGNALDRTKQASIEDEILAGGKNLLQKLREGLSKRDPAVVNKNEDFVSSLLSGPKRQTRVEESVVEQDDFDNENEEED